MELVLNYHIQRRLLWNGAGNLQNQTLGLLNSLLGAPDGDCGIAFERFVHVDLGAGVFLDIVDVGSSSAEDASDSAIRDLELDCLVVFPLKLESLRR